MTPPMLIIAFAPAHQQCLGAIGEFLTFLIDAEHMLAENVLIQVPVFRDDEPVLAAEA
jgi:hypothetical protein